MSENAANQFNLNGHGVPQGCTEKQQEFAKVKLCYKQPKIIQLWLQPWKKYKHIVYIYGCGHHLICSWPFLTKVQMAFFAKHQFVT